MIAQNTDAATWWNDTPTDVSPVLVAYGRAVNDTLPDASRQQLLPLIPAMAGTAGDGLDEARRYLALDWLVRTYAPAWLELAGLGEHARRLRELAPITDRATAQAAQPAVQEACRDAAVAGDVWAVTKTARAAAGDAADATGNAAWHAAGDAAWEDTGAAAWGAAWYAAGIAAGNAVKAVARAAAKNAAKNAARGALAPTVADLQASAVDLLKRMINP